MFTMLNNVCDRNEREKYAKHGHKSERHPSKCLSLIINGMDQDKTDIPHNYHFKSQDNSRQLYTRDTCHWCTST